MRPGRTSGLTGSGGLGTVPHAGGGCLTAAVLEKQLGERLGEVPVEGLWARPVSVSASGPRGKQGPCLPLCGAGCRSSKCPGLCPVFYVFVPVVFPLLSLAVAFGVWLDGGDT